MFYEPVLVYGFQETESDRGIICEDFLEDYGLAAVPSFVNDGLGWKVIYGIPCFSLEEQHLIHTESVHRVHRAVSEYREYTFPRFMMGLGGDIDFDLDRYDPRRPPAKCPRGDLLAPRPRWGLGT